MVKVKSSLDMHSRRYNNVGFNISKTNVAKLWDYFCTCKYL